MLVRKTRFDGTIGELELNITQDQLDRFNRREDSVQNIFPDLTADQREFLLTGMTPEEWDETFKEDEEPESDEDLGIDDDPEDDISSCDPNEQTHVNDHDLDDLK